MLSPSLKSQVLFHIYKTVIRKIPVFDSCNNIELRFLVNYMKTTIYLTDDQIIRQGDNGKRVYFISKGSLQVFIGPDETTMNLVTLERLQPLKTKSNALS
jgi:CRP-like cAMP-binding protein